MFFAVSILLLLIIYLFTRRIPILWRFSSAAFLAALFVFFLWVLEVQTRAELPWYEVSPYKHCLALAFMLAGMAGKYVFDAIEVRRKKKAAQEGNQKLELDRWDFFQPFIIAFIVFGSFWQLHGEEALDVNWLVISFQNGFFWQTILGKSL